jgi:hypothetical protein
MAKAFAELTPIQRHQLKRDDPKAYNAARSAWCKANGYDETIEREVRAGNRVIKRSRGSLAPVTAASGKPYEAMTNVERHLLRQQDPAAFNRVRNDWLARGEPLA